MKTKIDETSKDFQEKIEDYKSINGVSINMWAEDIQYLLDELSKANAVVDEAQNIRYYMDHYIEAGLPGVDEAYMHTDQFDKALAEYEKEG